jgi:uncharacterized repeat protein (TIGR01451 family)
MSRSDSSLKASRAKRIHWLTNALAVSLAGVCGCSTVNTNRMLGQRFATRDASVAATAGNQAATGKQTPSVEREATTMQLTDKPLSPTSNQIALVSYDHVDNSQPASGRPVATLASCQVSGSCVPASSCGCATSACGCQPAGSPAVDVQEYVCDGGDRDPRLAQRQDGSVAGLNPTDTVATYETYDGKVCITPTNRVCIYAPRFGAVRKVSGAILSEHAVATERILAPTKPIGFIESNPTLTAMLPVGPKGAERVSLIDALEDRNQGIPLEKVLPPLRMSDAIVPFQSVQFLATGLIHENELPMLRELWANAKSWDTTESLEILINDQPAVVQQGIKLAKEISVYDVPPGKCSLRICKAASHSLADSGDTISFSIRFDNIGATPIEKVVILDNLSPRLEYIEGSQQSSVSPEPVFTAEPNDVGSMTLRWELKPAIKAGEGGVIHFRCLVR